MRSIPVSADSVRRQDSKALLDRLSLEIDAARRAVARRKSAPMVHAARALLASLGSDCVRDELAQAAEAFAEGLEEGPDAERWVYLAVAARAVLEEAAKSGASMLARELEALDASLEGSREAVLLLEPEDYKEALAGTPPNTLAWWGERARLDAGLREIELERVLGDLGPAARCDSA